MKVLKEAAQFSKPFRVKDGKSFRLKDFGPAETLGLHSREKAEKLLQLSIAGLADLQEKLYEQDQWAVLLIFQAMDAAGKYSVIKHVMSGVNPQTCHVVSFKKSS